MQYLVHYEKSNLNFPKSKYLILKDNKNINKLQKI